MQIDKLYSFYIILVISIVTIILRVGPAILFPPNKETPPTLVFLGKVMPLAVIGMLLVYCFKTININFSTIGISQIIAALVTAAIYLYKRSTIFSILFGTITYMILVQVIF